MVKNYRQQSEKFQYNEEDYKVPGRDYFFTLCVYMCVLLSFAHPLFALFDTYFCIL